MNKTITASILSTLIATAPAIAQTDIHHAVFDFDDANSQTFELAVLSNDEMQTTEGEVIPALLALTLGGGAIGAWKTHYDSHRTTGTWASTRDVGKGTINDTLVGASLYSPATRVGRYTGTPDIWLRPYHSSFSKLGGYRTKSMSWGSNPNYRNYIGNQRIREINARFRETKLPGKSWRVQDRGHFHFRKFED